VDNRGNVSYGNTYNDSGVRPALFLKSGVSIQDISGEDGSYEKPYRLKIGGILAQANQSHQGVLSLSQ
jgi:hypothetical protein